MGPSDGIGWRGWYRVLNFYALSCCFFYDLVHNKGYRDSVIEVSEL